MIEELKRIVGEKYLFEDEGVLLEYSKDKNTLHGVRPRCVVKPRDKEQIIKIVELAKKERIPLCPVSSGPPHFREDSVPKTGGAIVLDLTGMKRIIRVDRKNRVCMFEPGVTFEELKEAVEGEGLRLNTPLLPRKTKSVLGSLLEREPVIMPKYQWDISDPLCCLEVIFGTGDIFRTGSAAGPGEIEEQWASGGAQKEAAGPSASSLYRVIQGAKGTLGIVTWATARCEILPKQEEPFFVSSKLERLLNAVHWLIRLRLVNECFILNNINLALIVSAFQNRSFDEIKKDLEPWILFFNLAAYDYLPEKRIKGLIEDTEELFKNLGIEAKKSIGGIRAEEFLNMIKGSSPDPYWKIRYKGNCQDIFFLTKMEEIENHLVIFKRILEEKGYFFEETGIYIQPLVQGVNYHLEFNLFFEDETQRMKEIKELTESIIMALLENRAFFSRPYGDIERFIINRDAASVKMLRKIKEIFDPYNILNPGHLCF